MLFSKFGKQRFCFINIAKVDYIVFIEGAAIPIYNLFSIWSTFSVTLKNTTTNSKTVKPVAKPAICKLVESKLSDGDVKGASRILFSNDAMAPNS